MRGDEIKKLCRLAVFAAILLATPVEAGTDNWVRRVTPYTDKPPYEPFLLELVASQNGQLIGTASYRDYRTARLPITIEGKLDAHGRFWPDVSLKTADDLNGPWTTIHTSSARDGSRAVFTVTPDSPNLMLYMALDAFRTLKGKALFGRVALKNEDSATFLLDNLTQPIEPESKPKKWDRQILFGGPPDPLVTGPFYVVSICGKEKAVEALCGYLDRSPGVFKGRENSEHEVRPVVSAQVGNDQHGPWLIVEAPTTATSELVQIPANKPEALLYVQLDVFRPWIGQFRYGKIILSNGKAALFELKDILP